MSIRLYLMILGIIFCISGVSVGLLILYMNPIPAPILSISLLFIGLFLALSSGLTPILFFIKKIYYRGDVHIYTLNASLRQAILIAVGILFYILLSILKITEGHIWYTALATLICIEVMFQAVA